MNIKEIPVGFLKIKAEDLTADDMPTQTMKDVFEICRKETALNLMTYMQGNIIQVPARPWINLQTKYIMENYDSSARSIKMISRTLCVTEKFVRDVLGKKIKDLPIEGQINLFNKNEEINE